MTNADRIRAMTDEELANIIEIVVMPNCNLRWDCEDCVIREFCRYGYEKFTALEWLRQPVKED